MMGYYFYYTLAANEEEKNIVRLHVASLADHLIAHDFAMMDVDGTHTRWSVWSPQLLNHDPEWSPDRSLNSMELLAFLKLAYYCTNDEKYQQQKRWMLGTVEQQTERTCCPGQRHQGAKQPAPLAHVLFRVRHR